MMPKTNSLRETNMPNYRCRYLIPFLFLVLMIPLTYAAGPIIIDRFSGEKNSDGLPKGWKLKQWFGSTHDIRLEEKDGNYFVRLISDRNSFGIFKEYEWKVQDHPVIRWRWKVTRLPDGGDVREKNKDDQAAQLYVLFPRFPSAINSRLVGYIWESTAPKGGKFTSKKSSNTRYVVLESGKEKLGEWITEERNVYDDYKELFGDDPPEAGGITLMIDSDDTKSSAESFFDDIEIQ
jgi:hypothetical protein